MQRTSMVKKLESYVTNCRFTYNLKVLPKHSQSMGVGGGCLIYIISLRKAVCEYITGLYFQSQSTSVIVGAELYCSVEFVTSDIAQGTVHRANICFTQLFLPNPFSSIPIQLHHSTKNKSRTYWVRSVAQNICPLGSPTQGTHFQRLAFTACFLSESKP